MRLVDTREQYLACEKPTQPQRPLEVWELNLLRRINQVCNKCDYARFILTMDNGRITLEQIGKPEVIKK